MPAHLSAPVAGPEMQSRASPSASDLSLRPGTNLSQTRKILRTCANEALVIAAVVTVLMPVSALYL